ncbi:CRISPR-associated endonuclease Cas3'' [Azospirillum sp. ST 5-10]|uniref:CRISPR-associated endonuclease Cas3'' n=1 Tax=unclassified Azospirillum TaxID=2630922 RepID=UPI003F4A1933
MAASPLYAHSAPGRDEGAWEPLSDHLRAVGDRAAGFAARVGCPETVRAMGRLHDLGKALPAFQAYIRGKGTSPDHSTAGAALAMALYGHPLGKLLAFGIAGHHAGLANGSRAGAGATPLKERLKGCAPPRPPAGIDLPPADAVLAELGARRRDPDAAPLAASLLGRMLFSCLVDADFLETERYYLGLDGQTPDRGSVVGLAEVRDRLAAHMTEKADKLEKPLSPVNALRGRVLDTVMERAALPPGLFSLTVPTGGGKTLASLAFALEHAHHHPGFRRVIHVIPFTSIVEQTADVFREALGDDDAVLEHHSAYDPGAAAKGTGRDDEDRDGGRKIRQAAENWDRPVVVTTAVQFFESLFAARPSRCRKLHNIAGSVIVLDEAQTLPLPFLRPCLEALRTLAADYRAISSPSVRGRGSKRCTADRSDAPARSPSVRGVDRNAWSPPTSTNRPRRPPCEDVDRNAISSARVRSVLVALRAA